MKLQNLSVRAFLRKIVAGTLLTAALLLLIFFLLTKDVRVVICGIILTAVMQFIEDNTKGRLTLGAGTLYGALNSLQEKGWIAPFGDSAGRKKEYLITTQGKEIAEKELIRLNELVGVANGIIGGAV